MTFTAALNFSSVDIFPLPTFNERQRVQYFYSPPYLLFRDAVSLFFVYSRDKIAYSLLAVKTLPESLSESVGARLADDDWRLPAVLLQRLIRPLSRIESHRIESNSSSELRKITGAAAAVASRRSFGSCDSNNDNNDANDDWAILAILTTDDD